MAPNPRSTLAGVTAHAGRISSPLPKILLGVALLAFFAVGSVLHIQTSEAFFLMGQTVRLSPNWSVLAQPWQLMNGQLNPKMAETTMWGWGIELVFLICVVGFEIAHDSIAASSRKMAGLFRTGAVVLILFDGYTDFLYGNIATGFWGQVGFASITAFVVFFFGTVGFRLLEHGLMELFK